MYVDETQDFTQAELRLVMSQCANLKDMFFCGDTAQTIASGVAFRFHDLRSLFKLEGQCAFLFGILPPLALAEPQNLSRMAHASRRGAKRTNEKTNEGCDRRPCSKRLFVVPELPHAQWYAQCGAAPQRVWHAAS